MGTPVTWLFAANNMLPNFESYHSRSENVILCLFLGSNEKMPKNLIVTQCSNNNQLFGSDKFASALVSSSASSSQDSIYVQLEKPTLIADRERKGVRQWIGAVFQLVLFIF